MKLSVITPTHDPRFLRDAWESLRIQTHTDWEWIVSVNGRERSRKTLATRADDVLRIVERDPRVTVLVDTGSNVGVGARKLFAFNHGTGEALVELDHDDILTESALTSIAAAFEDPEIGFVHSDWADFDTRAPDQGNITYRGADAGGPLRPGWLAGGATFYEMAVVSGPRPFRYEFARMPPASARTISTIHFAPNHVRAWRRSVYEQLGGHNPDYKVCDDHELLIRTYLATKMHHIPEPLYLYRFSGQNTWAQNEALIAQTTRELQLAYLPQLVLRECELLGLPAYDLGGAIDPAPGWKVIDSEEAVEFGASPIRKAVSVEGTEIDIVADLRERWPFEDNSVGAFRAYDFLEHLPDRLHTLREIHRCLRPGGWLLSLTPSTDGRGAWQDPTHVSFWNLNSFWYHLIGYPQTKYVRRDNPIFEEVNLVGHFPSQWHRDNAIPYVTANLVKPDPRRMMATFNPAAVSELAKVGVHWKTEADRPGARFPVVFYTALYGKHTNLKEFDTGGYPFFCFTDDPELRSGTWEIHVRPQSEHDKITDPRLAAKWVKLFPPTDKMPPHEISIWIDASIAVTDPQAMAETCVKALGEPGVAFEHDVAFFKHPERTNIYEEVVASSAMAKYKSAGNTMVTQAREYRDEGLPPDHGLYAGGVIARRNRPLQTAWRDAWWREITTRSVQDQISLPYVLWRFSVKPGIIPGSVYGTAFHTHHWTGPDR